jgi:4-carboxymuconolactone decarboxylase
MGQDARHERGIEAYRRVYGSLARETPEGTSVWLDSMVNQLFSEVWARDGLAIRDRRLLVIGILAAQGRFDMVEVQFRRALEAEELDLDAIEEAILQVTHYIGWGQATPIAMLATQLRAEATEGVEAVFDND